MENPGRVLSRRQIQERVWNHRDEGSGVVDTYIYYRAPRRRSRRLS
ncbi:winged helix-turn-helix domain-containing protein [Streptomyces caniscabiei]|nr:winged helix-turn-helix domain-containing protein [Streptomyces caniscabiei]